LLAQTDIMNQARIQKRNSLIIKIMVIIFTVISLLSCLIGGIFLSLFIGPGMFSETPYYIGWIVIIVAYGSFYLLPFFLCLPVILPLAIKNKNTSRIVIFRKFNSEISKKAVNKITGSIVSNYGHVFTLSDSSYNIKWYVKIPIILGQMSFFHFRQRDIKTDMHLLSLKNTLANKGWLNVNWLLSTNKIFAVKTTDALWQETAMVLLEECNLLIIDISELTDSINWESKVAFDLNFEQKIIVIANELKESVVLEWKNRFNKPSDYEIPVYYYDDKGVFYKSSFLEDTVCKILSNTNNSQYPKYRGSIVKKSLASISAVVVIFVTIFFFLSPYLIPNITSKYSPFPKQAVNAYIQSILKSDYEDSEKRAILRRIKGLWPKQAAEITLKYAYNHDRAECDAVAIALKKLADRSQWKSYLQLIEDGEPFMSSTAFDVLTSFNPKNSFEISLQLISKDRIDTKEFGLRMTEQKKLTDDYVKKLIVILSSEKFTIEQPPCQHKAKSTLGLENLLSFLRHKDTPDERVTKLFHRMYQLMQNPILINKIEVQKAFLDSKSEDAKILLSLFLLENSNAIGIHKLFDGYFISNYYNSELNLSTDSVVQLFSSKPFQIITDSIFAKSRLFTNIPPYDTLVKQLGNQSLISFPKVHINFLLTNYPSNNLVELKENIDASYLSDCLYDLMKGNSPKQNKNYLEIIKTREIDLQNILSVESVNLETRLNAAWLLSYIGNTSGVRVAAIASKIIKGGWIFENRPFEEQAKEVLSNLIKTKKAKLDVQTVKEIKDNLSVEMFRLVNKLQE